MLLRTKAQRAHDAATAAAGFEREALEGIHLQPGPRAREALERIAAKWECPIDEAARRVLVMALAGWKLRYAPYLLALREFVDERALDPFQGVCLTLRSWLDSHEAAMGEPLHDADVTARLEMILDTLRERRRARQPADLAATLAEVEQ